MAGEEAKYQHDKLVNELKRIEERILNIEERGLIDALEGMSDEDREELEMHLSSARDEIFYALDILSENTPE